jgi:hypothetical protein
MINKLIAHLVFCCIFIFSIIHTHAQGTVYTFMAGPTMSTQTLNGFEKDPFFRLHAIAQMESSSDISPNALYARLGYHIKGSAVNSRAYYDPISGASSSGESQSIEFHNLSVSVGAKQRREVGNNFVSYGFGIRGDFNLKTEYDPIFVGLTGTENNFTYGLDIDIGFEFPLSELVSTTIEFGFSPDLGEQIYIPQQNTGYYYPNSSQEVIIQESSIKNIVFELRVGFRFWRKVIYID